MSLSSSRLVLGVLAAFIALTRPHHFSAAHHLPDASLAAFFLAGVLVPSRLGFVALLALSIGIDSVAMAERGGLLHCVTPGYAGLPIAYGVLWQAGRLVQRANAFAPRRLPFIAAVLVAACALAFLSTSGGYYLFSGRFTDPSWAGFAERIAQYGLGYLWSPVPYVAVALVAHALWAARTAEQRPA